MAKEKKYKSYDDLLKKFPEFDGVISPSAWWLIGYSDSITVKGLKERWGKQLEENIDSGLWKKHGGATALKGLGKDKAVIAVGAGPSLKKNQDVLTTGVTVDGVKDWPDRNFITIASNHQFKPLLKRGVIPDFVLIADASDVVKKQLTEDIPASGQNTILLAGLQCDPGTLNEWSEQGRDIRFYMPQTEGLDKIFLKKTGVDPKPLIIQQGGNVLNSAWSIALKFLNSLTFIGVGNDLSFELKDDKNQQRASYYADGDYSTNAKGTGTGRDEAISQKKWAAFELKPKLIQVPGKSPYTYDLHVVGVSHTLWVYKTWLEANVLGSYKQQGNVKFHYYNCTEGGVAGVMAKNDADMDKMLEADNWFLLDEVCPRYHTMRLVDALDQFRTAKEMIKWQSRGRVINFPMVANSLQGGGSLMSSPSMNKQLI